MKIGVYDIDEESKGDTRRDVKNNLLNGLVKNAILEEKKEEASFQNVDPDVDGASEILRKGEVVSYNNDKLAAMERMLNRIDDED